LPGDELALDRALSDEGSGLSPERLLNRISHALAICLRRVDESKTMAADYEARQERYKARADTLKGEMFTLMGLFERRIHRAPEGTFSVKRGKVAALITDEAMIPASYFRTETKRVLDRGALLEDLGDGLVIPGAVLSNGADTLAFRRSRKPGAEAGPAPEEDAD
jgi:hypothetical protein